MPTLLDNLNAKAAILFQSGHNVTTGTYYAAHDTADGDAVAIAALRLQRPRNQHNEDAAGEREDSAATLLLPPVAIETVEPDVTNGQIVIAGDRWQFHGLLQSTPLCRKYRIRRVDHSKVVQLKGRVSSTVKAGAPQ